MLTRKIQNILGYFGCVFTRHFFLAEHSFWVYSLQIDIYQLNLPSVFTVKFNPKFKPFTQKIQIAKATLREFPVIKAR